MIHRYQAGSTSNSPILVLLHGTGGNEDSLIELGEELLPGAHLISPRGSVLEHGMPRFFRRLSEGVFDLEDLHLRTQELADGIAAAKEAYALTSNPTYLVGYSNGANIAANLMLTRGGVQGSVLFRALLPDPSITPTSLATASVLLLAGEHDTMISHDGTLALDHALRAAGASVALHWQPTGHQLGMSDVLIAKTWLVEHTS